MRSALHQKAHLHQKSGGCIKSPVSDTGEAWGAAERPSGPRVAWQRETLPYPIQVDLTDQKINGVRDADAPRIFDSGAAVVETKIPWIGPHRDARGLRGVIQEMVDPRSHYMTGFRVWLLLPDPFVQRGKVTPEPLGVLRSQAHPPNSAEVLATEFFPGQ